MLEVITQFLPVDQGYDLTRFIILRMLGVVYFFAFLSLVKQLLPLLGEKGLTPGKKYVSLIKSRYGKMSFWKVPTIFLFNTSDKFMLACGYLGLLLSLVVTFGYANVIILFVLWLIYLSFVHIGQVWYGYGWESEVVETGFLALFLVPLLDPRPFPEYAAPVAIIWMFWWLAFRVHFGAGLIKMRADSCWKDLTCLFYHFETQPIPNPLSRSFHFLPRWMLKLGVLWTHFAQLIVPVFIFIPQTRVVAGILLLLFQLSLMLSGNLSFLNLISIVAILAIFNDAFLGVFFTIQPAASTPSVHLFPWIVFIFLVVLSIPVVRNLFSRHQIMNTSFNQFMLVNTYGAFGAVGKKRYELVVQGTNESVVTPQTKWKEYDFVAKPTNVHRRPPIIAPYQPRIDWQIWFAAMESPQQNPWLLYFILKLLRNDSLALKLIKKSPFPDKPPKFIRVEHYIYSFAKPSEKQYWNRERHFTVA